MSIINDTPPDNLKDHQPDVKKYFVPLVEEGRKFLFSQNDFEGEEKNRLAGQDEEDEEED